MAIKSLACDSVTSSLPRISPQSKKRIEIGVHAAES